MRNIKLGHNEAYNIAFQKVDVVKAATALMKVYSFILIQSPATKC
jgi:hypothetical protein